MHMFTAGYKGVISSCSPFMRTTNHTQRLNLKHGTTPSVRNSVFFSFFSSTFYASFFRLENVEFRKTLTPGQTEERQARPAVAGLKPGSTRPTRGTRSVHCTNQAPNSGIIK